MRAELPAQVEVAGTTYTLRKFQSSPGHDWLRGTSDVGTHRSANAEVNRLVDEIVALRARLAVPKVAES